MHFHGAKLESRAIRTPWGLISHSSGTSQSTMHFLGRHVKRLQRLRRSIHDTVQTTSVYEPNLWGGTSKAVYPAGDHDAREDLLAVTFSCRPWSSVELECGFVSIQKHAVWMSFESYKHHSSSFRHYKHHYYHNLYE